MSIETRVVRLFRGVLKQGRHFARLGKQNEAEYCASQAEELRQRRHLLDPTQAEHLLEDAERRFAVAVHYGIPFEKPSTETICCRSQFARRFNGRSCSPLRSLQPCARRKAQEVLGAE